MDLTKAIKQKARRLGFDLAGITDASPIDDRNIELLDRWLKVGCAGRMSYMHRNFRKRINPAELLKNAQSVICVGLNYTPPKTQPPSKTCSAGRVANYAQYEDYHIFIKKQLRKLTGFMVSLIGDGLKFKICVDSAPLAERALAARAGLGFIGKNHMLINPKLGCQLLLGEIITTLKLKTDKPVENSCSDCNRCIDACPTGALKPDGQFDANKCISYLTIEYKDRIPPDLAKRIGDRLFGCDECVLACPYQKDAPLCKNKEFKFYSDRAGLGLRNILDMSEDNFEIEFADSPIKRLGLERLKRNAQICLANITR
ncbi:Epoxyqueuosine reductase [subsurface metagenome]